MIVNFKSVLTNGVQNTMWRFQSLLALSSSTAIAKEISGNILFIAPHADDELISSWKLLHDYKTRILVYYCGLTGGNKDNKNRIIREREIKTFTKVNCISLFVPENWIQSLVNVVDSYEIDCIFLPSYIDWHPEHRLINTEFLKCQSRLNRNISLFWYSVTVPIQCEKCLLNPLSKNEQSIKYRDFLHFYESQRNMPVERLRFQERANAKKLNYYAGEVYVPITFDTIAKAIRLFNAEELNKLKNSVNDIVDIRRKSNKYYKRLFSSAEGEEKINVDNS